IYYRSPISFFSHCINFISLTLLRHSGVQRMTAGRGVVHAEMPASKMPSRGLQLWVNLAREYKMIEPDYQDLKDSGIPRAKPEPGVEIKVIAGESFGVKSP